MYIEDYLLHIQDGHVCLNTNSYLYLCYFKVWFFI